MAQAKRNRRNDQSVRSILAALEAYTAAHPSARVKAYRQNSACVRVRIIDPDFQKMDRVERDDMIWEYLDDLPEDVQSEVSMLVLVTPEETKTSMANLEFEHPARSAI